MNRWKAALIHLMISVGIVGAIAAYILYFWYPPVLFHMAGVDRLLLLIGGVDLIVGPLLTLVVFKVGKPSLRFDLSVIALAQAAFLALGLYSMIISRPVFMVASTRTFDLVFANEIAPERLAEAAGTPYAALGFGSPRLVGARMPSDPKEAERVVDSAMSGHGDLQNMPRYFVAYQDVAPELPAHGKPLMAGGEVSAEEATIMQEAARGYGRHPEELRFMTLSSVRGYAVMLIDGKTGEVVGPAAVDP